jgi:hypothetical protein
MIGVVRKTIRPPACSFNGSMVQALQIFAHGIEPKVKQRQHPPYMALVECDSLGFDDCITGKFPPGKCHRKSMLPVEQGANAVTLSRVLPFCVTHQIR